MPGASAAGQFRWGFRSRCRVFWSIPRGKKKPHETRAHAAGTELGGVRMLESQSRGAGEGRPRRGRGAQDDSLAHQALILSPPTPPGKVAVPKVAKEQPGGPPPPILGLPEWMRIPRTSLREGIKDPQHFNAPPGSISPGQSASRVARRQSACHSAKSVVRTDPEVFNAWHTQVRAL